MAISYPGKQGQSLVFSILLYPEKQWNHGGIPSLSEWRRVWQEKGGATMHYALKSEFTMLCHVYAQGDAERRLTPWLGLMAAATPFGIADSSDHETPNPP